MCGCTPTSRCEYYCTDVSYQVCVYTARRALQHSARRGIFFGCRPHRGPSARRLHRVPGTAHADAPILPALHTVSGQWPKPSTAASS